MDKKLFETDPRSYALELVEDGVRAENLLLCALKYMSHDDVRDMLDCNELSPRLTRKPRTTRRTENETRLRDDRLGRALRGHETQPGRAARQITEDRFDDMLGVLPPANWTRGDNFEVFHGG
jgi:hypothetical protein